MCGAVCQRYRDCIEKSVHTLKTHPLMPKDIEIKGFIMDSETGELTEV